MANEWERAQFTIDTPGLSHDETTILDGIEDFLTQVGWEVASWSAGTYGSLDRHFIRTDRAVQDRWQFRGDGPLQHAGIRVFYDSDPQTTTGLAAFAGQEHIVVQSFLENSAETDRQVTTPDYVGTTSAGSTVSDRFGSIRVQYDDTAPNNWLVIGGEDGLYLEVGRDSSETNLGHGAILTFGAIPENNSPFDSSVDWTAQGLVCDLFDVCRFTHDRGTRFVSNDGSNKNFTASLQPYSPRGTRELDTPNMADQVAYYVGSRDTMLGMGRGANSVTSATSNTGDVDIKYHATFGLVNTPEVSRFRISPLVMAQSLAQIAMGATSTSSSNTVAAQANVSQMYDPRTLRQIFRFAAVDYTLLSFQNIQDAVSGATYRVARVEDNGRFSQIGVIWPSSSFLSITL